MEENTFTNVHPFQGFEIGSGPERADISITFLIMLFSLAFSAGFFGASKEVADFSNLHLLMDFIAFLFFVPFAAGVIFLLHVARSIRKKDREVRDILKSPSSELRSGIGVKDGANAISGVANRERIVLLNELREELSVLENDELKVFDVNDLYLTRNREGSVRLNGAGLASEIDLPGAGEAVEKFVSKIEHLQECKIIKRIVRLDNNQPATV